MDLKDYFISSTVSWFRSDAKDVAAAIVKSSFPEQNHLSQDPSKLFRPGSVAWDASARDAGANVSIAAERLLRWDDRHPTDVFRNGLTPDVVPKQSEFPAQAMNLRTFDNDQKPSIFVGTSRYQKTADGKICHWVPAHAHQFEYEIFAFGGIDVNAKIGGPKADNAGWKRQTIAFPGGIRPEFIRSAREHDDHFNVIRIWRNTAFNIAENPANQTPPMSHYPNIAGERDLPLVVVSPTAVYPPSFDTKIPSGVDCDPMRIPGTPAEDTCLKLGKPFRPRCSIVYWPGEKGKAYAFFDGQYAVIFPSSGPSSDSRSWGPNMMQSWPGLLGIGFAAVDAAIERPGKEGKFYFFFRDQCALVHVIPGSGGSDTVLEGPTSITSMWPSLKEAGFTTVDAIFPVPGAEDQAYVFSGDKYAKVNLPTANSKDTLRWGPSAMWASLVSLGFKNVDMVLPHPTISNRAFFFSGDNYGEIEFTPSSSTEKVIRGPLLIKEWKSLSKWW